MPKHRPPSQRVVITGLGALTPIGNTVADYWKSLVEGRSGIAHFTLINPEGYPCTYAGEVKGFSPENVIEPKAARRMARFSQFAVVAAAQAIADAKLDMTREDPFKVGVLLGNGNGGYPTIEEGVRTLVAKGGMRLSPFFFPMTLPNMAASQVSLTYGLKGYSSTVVTACAAGNQAIGEAAEVIRRGNCDVMVTGGVEAGISLLGLGGFAVMKALSTGFNDDPSKASRPFDAKRDGFIPAEGAGILIIESLEHAMRRGATIHAEILGYGASADAFHIVAPDEDGAGAAKAMERAIEDAGLAPEEVDYINAHGTSTPLNDLTETLAIKRLFGKRAFQVPISSSKSMIGHGLGAAGGMEAVACVKTITEGIIHPTINQEVPDPKCDLDYVPNIARKKEVRVAIKNSFGFGGQNACVAFGRFEA
ncbi:MAG: beta-ketoacyl-ACP synthase II [Chloroflexi bacterium]|nr:beta-ketoacyl-ACP synthase II [Chloroflexota bacterium]